uniref:AIG1 family protein n=1 Tax=Marseillevirus LCMAC103 TaxID=2506604 RepID=A0A481YU72_9VIRU|nr:MAG: AIG1 family protein [Marseillevirus LCMAC103]
MSEKKIDLDVDTNVVFVGNPGSGKSTIVNAYIGRIVSQAGFSSDGHGLTKNVTSFVCTRAQQKPVMLVDTPGLNDIGNMRRATYEIVKGLTRDGMLKVIFVITLETGRLRSADVATINVVCNAIQTPFECGVIVNKLSRVGIATLQKSREIFDLLESQLKNKPSAYHLVEFDIGAFEEPDVMLSEPSQKALRQFVDSLRGARIESIEKIPVMEAKAATSRWCAIM